FAGMGGTLIVDILKGAEWIKDRSKRYIFQPMSRSEDVREYLTENGFVIIREDACFDECRPYIAFCARFSPEEQTPQRESYKFIGELYKCKNEAAAYYFTKKYLYLKERADALERANLLPEEVRMIKAVLPDIYPLTRRVEQ
ncbi:MAG: class I SAM-dependent methyltransferase, partial [Clostridiales bacterium]|nr:class I SAM-dependent methyltransferase [Clostridiales bacterium]